MRDIKFRAWDKRENEMIEEFHTTTLWELHDFWEPEESNYVLMQATGLTDKNGKEIYEGDIVSTAPHMPDDLVDAYYEVVKWDQKVVTYWPFNQPDLKADDCEVIGNIYENPEILQSTKEQE